MAILTSGTSTCGSMEQVASSFSARHCVYLKSLSSQRQHQRPRCFRYSYDKLSKLGTSEGSPRMILNGYVGRDTYRMKKDNDEKIYRRLDSCYVIPPPKGKKPKAIIKFLGGAFIGAVPEVTYGSVVLPVFILFPLFYLLGLLANEGYLIISVPYNVTFDHSQAAREVFERFYSCLNSVLTYGLPSDGLLAAELVDLPLYSVGHSNGALLQVLGGSYFSDKLPKRHFEVRVTLLRAGPQVSQMMPMVEASPVSSMAVVLQGVSLDKFVDQLPSVFNQVKFNTDAIDETDLLEETLKPRVEAIGGTLDIVSLSGNHMTLCISLDGVKLVFFPMLDTDLRHYFIVYMNLKYNRIEYLDNIFSIETDPNARYGFPSMTLIYRQMSASAEKRILTLGCRTTNNSIDCGVFVMRHMETYRGEGDRGDRCCLKKEGPEQHKQINDLRYKYATKILLADCNKAKSMVEQETHAFKILPVEEKKRLWAEAFEKNQTTCCADVELKFPMVILDLESTDWHIIMFLFYAII
ncbi:alpha/beta hydrolase fold protein [Tanacetum coccineum]